MNSDTPIFSDDADPPTEEIYIKLRELETAAAETRDATSLEPSPVVADDAPTGIKGRIARLRAILSDRGAEPLD
ncbi:MAG: hypothetical protein QGD89_01230 [Actinomycetota bacterium]|nr:hypothetical protein [Actinomycetota bacterium]